MNTLNFNLNINEIKSIKNKSVRGTLLLPKNYLRVLDLLRFQEKITLEELLVRFSFLIEKKVILIIPNIEKHTTLYQGHTRVKLDLIRLHLRCRPMIWHHWKRLSNHFGVSMCNLFFICLRNVALKDLESVGTPTNYLNFHNFFFFEVTNFTRNYSHRWFHSRAYRKKRKIIKK